MTPEHAKAPASTSSQYPSAARTPMQQQVWDCARCLLAQDEEIKNEALVACTGLSNTTTYACLEKFAKAELFLKEKGEVEGKRRGGPPVLYTPNPDASDPIRPQLQPDCPTKERHDKSPVTIPEHYTPQQRKILECIACWHQKTYDNPSPRIGITTASVQQCTNAMTGATAHTFKRTAQAGIIEQKGSQGREKIYKATDNGKQVLDTIVPDVICPSKNSGESDASENSAKVMRCLACLALQSRNTDTPLTAQMVKECIGNINIATLYRNIASLEGDGLLLKVPLSPQTHLFRIKPRPSIIKAAGLGARPPTCRFDLASSSVASDELRFLSSLSDFLDVWQIKKAFKYYPDATQAQRAVRYLERLYEHGLVKTANVNQSPKTPREAHNLRSAIQNRVFDPKSGNFVTIGPNLSRFSELQRQAILHVHGADLFVYGHRFRPSSLHSSLKLDSNVTLANYVRTLLGGI